MTDTRRLAGTSIVQPSLVLRLRALGHLRATVQSFTEDTL